MAMYIGAAVIAAGKITSDRQARVFYS